MVGSGVAVGVGSGVVVVVVVAAVAVASGVTAAVAVGMGVRAAVAVGAGVADGSSELHANRIAGRTSTRARRGMVSQLFIRGKPLTPSARVQGIGPVKLRCPATSG